MRESFSFWTGHPYDFEIWLRNAYNVSLGRNPYSAFFPPVPGISFAYINQTLPSVGYLPLWSLILASIYHIYAAFVLSNRFFLYFLIKQPEIIGDMFLGYLLSKIILRFGGTAEAAGGTLQFWMLCPFPIIVSAIWGQFDGLVASLWVSFLLVQLPFRRSILLGLGVFLKFFPGVVLPYYLLRGRLASWRIVALAVLVPVVFTLLIFTVLGWSFQPIVQTLLFETHGAPAGMTYTRILAEPFILSIVTRMPYFLDASGLIWIPVTLIACLFAVRIFPRATAGDSVQAGLLVLTIFFLTRWYIYEQYLVYLLSFLLIDVALWHPERRALCQLTWIFGLIFLSVNNFFLIRFFGPIVPSAVDYDYFLDNTSVISGARNTFLDVFAVIFSLHLVQLALVVSNPKRDAMPWISRIAKRVFEAFHSDQRKILLSQ